MKHTGFVVVVNTTTGPVVWGPFEKKEQAREHESRHISSVYVNRVDVVPTFLPTVTAQDLEDVERA